MRASNKFSSLRNTAMLSATLLALAAGHAASAQSDYGPAPHLPPPERSLIPTVEIAPAKGWPEGATPKAASGLQVSAFAKGLDHPRWLYVLPNGDVLVAEANTPSGRQDAEGLRGWAMRKFMEKAGSSTPSANRITLLRDSNGDGVVDTRTIFIEGLNSPFGMALVGNDFYVANTDGVVRFAYEEGQTRITGTGERRFALPAGLINHHWTKNIIASRDGGKLYATVGSNSNVAENGIENEESRAAILELDLATGNSRSFASGLRNPNGLAWNPETGALWTTVNERDELGNELPPDYMTSVKEGGFYGWPYSYFGQHVDDRVEPQRPDLVGRALMPDYALGAHTACFGLAFYESTLLPEHYRHGAFIGQRGSWNRKPKSGYRVIFVPFRNGRPAGGPEEVLTGFLNDRGEAQGRPVGVVVDKTGALLVADDVGNTVWRVTPAPMKKPEEPMHPTVQ